MNITKKEKGNILIVDDDKKIREGIALAILNRGYRAKTARDGFDAINTIKSDGIVLIIADMKMPRMDGRRLLEEVKKRWPEIPVIVLTGYTNDYPRTEILKEGAIDYFEKPFQPSKLFDAVKKALGAN